MQNELRYCNFYISADRRNLEYNPISYRFEGQNGMNTDDLLKKQIALTQKIIERMDYIIDGIKMELNITKDTDPKVTFYTPSGKKEWFGIPDSIVIDDDDLDQMDACLVRNVAKSQRKTILKMEIEMEALRAIIDDMREQVKDHELLVRDYDELSKKYILLNDKYNLLTTVGF